MLDLVKRKERFTKASNATMAEQFKTEASQLNQVRSLQELRQRWLKVLFSLFLLLLSSLWLYEALILGRVNPIDRLAYPLMLSLITASLGLLQINPRIYKVSLIGTVGVITIYQFLVLQAIIWGYIPASDTYKLTTFAQWFPLLYILLFLFLKKQQALVLSGFIYLCLGVAGIVRIWIEQKLPVQEHIFSYLLHMILAHPLYIAIFTTVASLQSSFSQVQAQAVKADIDHLTNLANRRAASRALEAVLEDQTEAIGVMLIDIDRFKRINDTFGHGIGDQVLVQTAQLFQQGLRKTDIASRWGGEEFLIILIGTTAQELYQTAERLRQGLANYPHPSVGPVTASFGVALAKPGDRLETLLRRADAALYRAKQAGRNRVVAADAFVQNFLY
jgi:diguanylate cyclase (GGDEF)-like protein